ncbi:cyclic pyranopterin monophosphate synthase MoaC [Flammeovirgaceae bacterium SG7u.111]|nr:cyclic pyranopterin monophosphate synthase MoaC [Flammeovirgaceae bacterium SG7u.132]WPO38489.1 cyclic pyranopterin monophosphate synthase MoaC [Flammeovirgaceae bacterium SG7u.111]
MNDKDKKLSHLDAKGNPAMVNVSEKKVSLRMATARSEVKVGEEILSLLQGNELYTKKGAVFQTAVIAGTMAAKKTGDLIPLCHPIGLEDCKIHISNDGIDTVQIDCTTVITAKTGVEMEALVGASVAALTIYDMCKAMSHDIIIKETKLMEKTGGKKDFRR